MTEPSHRIRVFAKTARSALALAVVTLKLSLRDRRAFLMGLVFPMVFLFLFGLLATAEGPLVLRELIARVIGLSIMTGSFMGQGLGLAVQRERGMLRRYRLTPLGADGLLAGTAMAGLALVSFTITLQLILWRAWFHQPEGVGWGALALVIVISALAMTSLGLIIAAVASTMQEAQILFQLVLMASLLLSDLTVPLDILPEFLQRLAVFLPATHMVHLLRDAMAGAWNADLAALFALVLMTAASFAVSARLFRWERDDPLPRRARWAALMALAPVLLFGVWQNAHPTPRPPHPFLEPPPASFGVQEGRETRP